MIQHAESAHGRGGVYKGVRAWEAGRQQKNAITRPGFVPEYSYEVDDSMYNHYEGRWECEMCDGTFAASDHLLQHLQSGTHEDARYDCDDCDRTFSSLSALRMHLNYTGHSRKKERLTHVMITDAQQSQLLLTNDYSGANYECTLYFDGAAQPNPGKGGCGWYLVDDRGYELVKRSRAVRGYELVKGSRAVRKVSDYDEKVTNNEAEYMGLICGMKEAIEEGVRDLLVKGDSQLVIRQMTGENKVKSANLIPLHARAANLVTEFRNISFEYIPRAQNYVADKLAKSAIPDYNKQLVEIQLYQTISQ